MCADEVVKKWREDVHRMREFLFGRTRLRPRAIGLSPRNRIELDDVFELRPRKQEDVEPVV